MAKKRKRPAGAGMPARGEFSGLDSVLSVRMPAEMRKTLEVSASRRRGGKGWSLTQEMLYRLQRSFDRERDERRDPASRALCYLLAEVISNVARNSEEGSWRSDPFAYRAIKLAFGQILDALEPKGEIRAPRPSEEPLGSAWLAPGAPIFQFFERNTPEDLARFIRDVVLMQFSSEPESEPSTDVEPLATVSRTREQQDFEFGMSDARRALQLPKEPKS